MKCVGSAISNAGTTRATSTIQLPATTLTATVAASTTANAMYSVLIFLAVSGLAAFPP